jgi:hypothetical protein
MKLRVVPFQLGRRKIELHFSSQGARDFFERLEGAGEHLIEVPALQVVATEADVPSDPGEESEGISFLKEQQWKTPGFATAFATSGSVPESFEAPGELRPAAGRFARVSAPIAGVLEPTGLAEAPAPGQRVIRGQALAVLTPTLGDGGSSYASARAELRGAEEEYGRAKRLYQAEAIVHLVDRGHCGSGGCTTFVLTQAADGWHSIGKLTVSRLPIYRLPDHHNGWFDLAVYRSGAGVQPGLKAIRFAKGRYGSDQGLRVGRLPQLASPLLPVTSEFMSMSGN